MNFELIEDGLISALKTGLPYAKQVESYAGQLEGEIGSLVINYPAVFVIFDGAPLGWVDGRTFEEVDTFSILVVSSDVRGRKELRKNAATGCYRMIKDVLKTLANNNLGLTAIQKLQPVNIYPVLISSTLAIYGVKFKTNFDSTY